MLPADFRRLAARTRLGPRAAEAARLHLIVAQAHAVRAAVMTSMPAPSRPRVA